MPLEKSRAIFLTRMQHAVSVIYFLSISLSLSLSLSLPLSLSLSLSFAEALFVLYGREAGRKKKEARVFPSSPAHFLFFDYCYFYWDTQLEPLRRRELFTPIIESALLKDPHALINS